MTHVFRVNLPEGSKIKHATSTQRFLAWPSTAIPLFDFLGVYFIVSRPEKKTWLRSLKSFSWSSIDNIHLTRICSILVHTDIQGVAFIHCSWTSFFFKNHFTWSSELTRALVSNTFIYQPINPISIPCSVLIIIRALIAILIFGTSIYELIAIRNVSSALGQLLSFSNKILSTDVISSWYLLVHWLAGTTSELSYFFFSWVLLVLLRDAFVIDLVIQFSWLLKGFSL